MLSFSKKRKLLVMITLMLFIITPFSALDRSSTAITSPANITNVIVIMQENHTFDSMFWSYPGVVGGIGDNSTYCLPLNPNQPYPTKTNPCYKPIPFTTTVPGQDLPHSAKAATSAYNKGQMNGFLANTVSKKYPTGTPSSYSYYDSSTIPMYWALAQHFALSDMFFSSVASYSQPNHWYMLAGISPAVSVTESASTERSQVLYNIPYRIQTKSGQVPWTTYLDQSQTIQTIVEQMSASALSWNYYDAPISNSCQTLLYALASVGKTCTNVDPYGYWNPLEAQNTSYTMFASHFQWRGQIINDIQNGKLPDVSWVIPAGAISDHPPANVTLGQYWVSDVVDAIENSQYWDHTLIIVAWDDFGGFFDTIAPPNGISPQDGLGFRAPAIIISPYVVPGSIANTVFTFESILKFIDNNWGLVPLNARVASANDIGSVLNLNQKPLLPFIVPLTSQDLSKIQPCLFSNQKCNVNLNLGANTINAVNGICYIGCPGNGTAFINSDED